MTEKRRDDRDAKKADENLDREVDESMQMAELQVGEEEEAEARNRFVPDQVDPEERRETHGTEKVEKR